MRYLLYKILSVYRLFISPILGNGNCRFYPTCSSYAQIALKNYSLIKALFLIFKRLIRCHPLGTYDYDPVPVNEIKKH